jgi:hypothetical protein
VRLFVDRARLQEAKAIAERVTAERQAKRTKEDPQAQQE